MKISMSLLNLLARLHVIIFRIFKIIWTDLNLRKIKSIIAIPPNDFNAIFLKENYMMLMDVKLVYYKHGLLQISIKEIYAA